MKLFGWFRKKPVSSPDVLHIPEKWTRNELGEAFTQAIMADMDICRADRVEIETSDGSIFRGMHEYGGTPLFWNTDTFAPAFGNEIYALGIVSGVYSSREAQRYYTKNSEHEILATFRNEVSYERAAVLYPECYVPKTGEDGKEVARLLSLEVYNPELVYHIYTSKAGVKWYVDLHNLQIWVNAASNENITICDEVGISLTLPRFVVARHRNTAPIVPCNPETSLPVEVRDPIRIIELFDGDRQGEENYVCLSKGKVAGTRHRHRYVVELDTEVMYANSIVAVYAVCDTIQQRINMMDIDKDGRLYLDSIRCYRRDGSTHTFDPAGFQSIGCEVHFSGHDRVLLGYNGIMLDSQYGVYLVTNTSWPKEASY